MSHAHYTNGNKKLSLVRFLQQKVQISERISEDPDNSRSLPANRETCIKDQRARSTSRFTKGDTS